MSAEHPQDPLEGLFSDDSPEEGESGGARGQAGMVDLAMSGLFSSDEDDDQRSGIAEVRDDSAALASSAPGASATAERELEVCSREDRSGRGTAVAGEQISAPVSAGSTAIAMEPTGGDGDLEGDREPASLGMPEAYQRPIYLPAAEVSTGAGLAAEDEPILNAALAAATIGGGILVALRLADHLQRRGGLVGAALLLGSYLLVSAALALRRIPSRWRIAVLVGVSYAAAFYALLTQGVAGAGAWYLLAIPVVLFALIGERYGLASAVANAALYVAFAAAYRLGWLVTLSTADAGDSLRRCVTLVVAFSLTLAAIVIVHALLGRAQRRMRLLLQQHDEALRAVQAVGAERQQRLEHANAALGRQLRHSELATEMGRLAAIGLDLEELVVRAVELIREGIGADYVGLYLLDDDRAHGQLQAEAGPLRAAGRGPNERTRVSDDLLLRQCVNSGRPQILLGVDDVRDLTGTERGSPFLHSDARSALALPLVARGTVFGAVSVQSRVPTAFDNLDVASLRTTLDQLSSAISNARLAQELREHLEHLERLQSYYVRDAWDQYLIDGRGTTYAYHRPEVKPLGEGPLPEVERVLADPRLVAVKEGDVSALLVPIVLRDEVLGVFGLHRPGSDEPWTEEQIELLAAISEQMGLTIENARLFAEARARAVRERRVRQAVARLRESLDVEEVLAIAVREMGDALHLEDVTIRLTGTEERIGG